ncbi:MAG: outer membrane beta-barrel protein [Pseudomonadota bacterium]
MLKRTLTSLGVSAGLLLMAAGAAGAGDTVHGKGSMKDDVYAPGFSWSGYYAHVAVGAGWAESDWEQVFRKGLVSDRKNGDVVSFDLDGIVVNGTVGVMSQMGSIVHGVEAAFGYVDFDESELSGFRRGDDVFQTQIDFYATVAYRLGYAWDRLQIYAKAGYAGANVETSIVDDSGWIRGSGDDEEWHHGYLLGAGFDYALTSRIILGVEYNYMDFGSTTHDKALGRRRTTINDDVELEMHTVAGRVGVKF